MNRDIELTLARMDRVAHTMENLIPIPGTDIRFGLDALTGFVPVIGDLVTLLPASYILHASHQLGAPRRTLIRMGLNLAVDALVGMVPFFGDIFDVGWNANTRNVALLRDHLNKKAAHDVSQAALENFAASA